MEQQTTTEYFGDAPKLYKDRHVYAALLLGGPLAGGYLIAENFKAFGDIEQVRKTWIYAAIATVVIFTIGYFMAEVKFPPAIIPFTYAYAGSYYVKIVQGARIESHIAQGGQLYGWPRVLGFSLLMLAGTLLFLVAVFMAVGL